jgi:hypothetical protein
MNAHQLDCLLAVSVPVGKKIVEEAGIQLVARAGGAATTAISRLKFHFRVRPNRVTLCRASSSPVRASAITSWLFASVLIFVLSQ